MSDQNKNIIYNFIEQITNDYFKNVGDGALRMQYLERLFNNISPIYGHSFMNLTNITKDKEKFKKYLIANIHQYSDEVILSVINIYTNP